MENMMLLNQKGETAYKIEDIKEIYVDFKSYKYDFGLPDDFNKPYRLYIIISYQNIQKTVVVGEYMTLKRAKQALEDFLYGIEENLFHIKVLEDDEKD